MRPRPKLLEQIVFGLAGFLVLVLAYFFLIGRNRRIYQPPAPGPSLTGGRPSLPPPDTSANTLQPVRAGRIVPATIPVVSAPEQTAPAAPAPAPAAAKPKKASKRR